MKSISLLSAFLFLGITLTAQPWESYLISIKGDTINGTDMKKLKQGRWVVKVEALRGEPGYEEEGEFLDSKKEGLWRRYNLTGDLLAVENYRWGFRDGKQMYFTPIGDLLREEAWRAVNPDNPYDTIEVPDLNNPAYNVTKVVKQDASEIRHGTWNYFDPSTGRIMKTESFNYGMKLDASGRPIMDTTGNAAAKPVKPSSTTPAKKPAAVEEWEKNQNGKKEVKVRDGRTTPGGG
jgi:hypothetical protein